MVALSSPPAAGRRRWWTMAAGAAALALVAATLGMTWRARGGRPALVEKVASAVSTPPTAVTPAPPPAAVTLTPPPAPAPAQPSGAIDVEVDVNNARIEVDGQVVADPARGAHVDVTARREHAVLVSAPGRRRVQRVVTVGESATVKLDVRLPAPQRRERTASTGGSSAARPNDEVIDAFGASRP